MFYYVKNLQGDIVKILDEDGNEKASYVYNAWGDILSQSEDELSSINPLRYRGYVYDEDTTLYYLQTRYYDPTTGRFINADDTAFIGSSGTAIGDNIYTYCENDPVNNVDYTGQWYHSLKQFKRHLDKIIIPSQYYNEKRKYDLAYGHYYFNKNNSPLFFGYIFGQYDKRIKNVRMGTSNVLLRNNGCGLVAIYNVLIMLGKRQYLHQIILEAELNGMLSWGGTFGTSSSGIEKFFKSHGFKFKKVETYKKLKKERSKTSIIILYMRNEGSLSRHYYCVYRTSSGYYSLNRYNENTCNEIFSWKYFEKVGDPDRFIRAFCFY